MTLIYPNIVPENNLRLPDALTIKHGPARLLATFVLEGDKAAREIGVRLRLRHDFGELVYVNKHAAVRQSWQYSELMPTLGFGSLVIGLAPLTQWLVLPPLSLYLARRRAFA